MRNALSIKSIGPFLLGAAMVVLGVTSPALAQEEATPSIMQASELENSAFEEAEANEPATAPQAEQASTEEPAPQVAAQTEQTAAVSLKQDKKQPEQKNFSARGGLTFTALGIPMFGVSAVVAYHSPMSLIPFIDSQEATFYYHNLSGSKNIKKNDLEGNVSVSWQSIEIDYWLLSDLGDWKFGPGIGYGIGELNENTDNPSLSPYYTATDVHYGILALKGVTNIYGLDCEATLNSYGGLISGGFLCGYEF